jgi:hypothetical protein
MAGLVQLRLTVEVAEVATSVTSLQWKSVAAVCTEQPSVSWLNIAEVIDLECIQAALIHYLSRQRRWSLLWNAESCIIPQCSQRPFISAVWNLILIMHKHPALADFQDCWPLYKKFFNTNLVTFFMTASKHNVAWGFKQGARVSAHHLKLLLKDVGWLIEILEADVTEHAAVSIHCNL